MTTRSHKWIGVKAMSASVRQEEAVRGRNPSGRAEMPWVKVVFEDTRPRGKGGFIEELTVRLGETEVEKLRAKRELIEDLRGRGYWVMNKEEPRDASVYVVLLDSEVREQPKARKMNPDADPAKPCYYVGQTRFSPEERLEKHRAGVKASRWVSDFTKSPSSGLQPDLYEHLNPMTREEALENEMQLARELQAEGCTVLGGH